MNLSFVIKLILAILPINSCNRNYSITHIDSLTQIYPNQSGDTTELNRVDCFLIFNSDGIDKNKIKVDSIRNKYSNEFAKKYSNYVMVFYRNSPATDTNYLNRFPKGLEHKAINEDPLLRYHWYKGKLILKD